jgi:hypothetical protein
MCWNVQLYSIVRGSYHQIRLKPFVVALVASPNVPGTSPTFRSAYVSKGAGSMEVDAFRQLILKQFNASELNLDKVDLKLRKNSRWVTGTIPSILEYRIELPSDHRAPDRVVSDFLYSWLEKPIQGTGNVAFSSQGLRFTYSNTHALSSEFSVSGGDSEGQQ